MGARECTLQAYAKYTDATDFINREWHVVSSGIGRLSGPDDRTCGGDIAGTESMIMGVPTIQVTGDLIVQHAVRANTVTASTTTGDVLFSGQNFWQGEFESVFSWCIYHQVRR